tara:strand:- start:6 stop:188 length:183 start_codon:yes stop_codon:yes gene_type:complete
MVPDRFKTIFGNRERITFFRAIDTVAGIAQTGAAGIGNRLIIDALWGLEGAMGRIDRHFV